MVSHPSVALRLGMCIKLDASADTESLGFVFDWSERGSPDLHALLGLPNEGFPDDYPICDAIGAAECTRERMRPVNCFSPYPW